MMLRIASFNVNSIRARLQSVITWLEETAPDIACLQETKCSDEQWPRENIEALGYNLYVHGQKSYNGVAILSKYPAEDIFTSDVLSQDAAASLCPVDSLQARYIEALFFPKADMPLRIVCLYAPNGNPCPGEKFAYKLRWSKAFNQRARALFAQEEYTALCGDFNVIPDDLDVAMPQAWANDAAFHPQARDLFHSLRHMGWLDSFRALQPNQRTYSFWPYQGGAFSRDEGVRIDMLMTSPRLSDHLLDAQIETRWRGRKQPSDHAPCALTCAFEKE